MYKKISMTDYRAVSKDFDKKQAKQKGLPIWLRIYHAAAAEMNRSGHSFFGGWENIADFIKIDGESVPQRNAIYKGIKTAIEYGYLSDESDATCLSLDGRNTEKAAHGGYGCKHPKHGMSYRTAEQVRLDIAEAKKEEELPEGIDPLTGEILEEATESLSEVSSVLEVPETVEEPETAVQSLSEASERRLAKYKAQVVETPAVVEESQKEEAVEIEGMTMDDFLAWTDELSELGQDLAYHGLNRRSRDSFEFIVATVLEGLNEKHDEWGNNVNMRYTYAQKEVVFEGVKTRAAKKKELVEEGMTW